MDISADLAAVQARIAQITGEQPPAQPAPPIDVAPGSPSFRSYLGNLVNAEMLDRQQPRAAMQMPVSGPITSDFGERNNPMGAGSEFHPGVDIGADEGTPIQAAVGGTVVSTGRDGGYGNLITIDDGSGVTTLYGHCSQILARVGQRVAPGDVIGLVGMTGRATGPHLHFEVRRDDSPVDPKPYLTQPLQ